MLKSGAKIGISSICVPSVVPFGRTCPKRSPHLLEEKILERLEPALRHYQAQSLAFVSVGLKQLIVHLSHAQARTHYANLESQNLICIATGAVFTLLVFHLGE